LNKFEQFDRIHINVQHRVQIVGAQFQFDQSSHVMPHTHHMPNDDALQAMRGAEDARAIDRSEGQGSCGTPLESLRGMGEQTRLAGRARHVGIGGHWCYKTWQCQ